MFGGFFYVLFSGSYLSAHATQNLYIHSISGNGRKPVKKIIPNYASLLLAMKPEVESPLNRICISYNRRGHRAFAVFLLLFFIGMCRRAVSAVGCRSPPIPSGFLHFQKFELEEIRVAYNHGREDRKWRIWKEAEEREYKKIELNCREGVRAQLERMKELRRERNNLYEKQNDLKGQKWRIEKSLER